MSTGEKPRPEEELFEHALALPPAEREAFLSQHCGDDAALRRAVDELLRAHDEAGAFMGEPVAPPRPEPSAAEATIEEKPGDRIGRYKLLEKIGEGGFGVVWLAEQEEPMRRRVALKVIKLGMDTREVVTRFEVERQALALMDHPNIAKVFDGGATPTGRPFFVMELVHGIPLTTYCDKHLLDAEARLRLFADVCHAVQHAHQKGIIHRDLKPSNILVTFHDGKPVPKVIDFGIAKATGPRLTDKTLFTHFHAFIGTPAYTSPEQVELSGLDVDTRSDIYSLGVLLYELLTGRPPFDPTSLLQAGLEAMRRTIREVEPPRPSARLATLSDFDRSTAARQRGTDPARLSLLLRGDLDWIVMRCLEKDRRRRYETASSLADDIRRHLTHEPVSARPPGAFYLLGKLARRHRAAVSAVATVAAVLALATVVSAVLAVRATRAERAAAAARLEAENQRANADEQRLRAEKEATLSHEVATFVEQMFLSVAPYIARGRDTRLLRDILDDTAERLGQTRAMTDQPEVELKLRRMLGAAYGELGEFPRSAEMYERALELLRQLRGPEHPDTLAGLGMLGAALQAAGRLPEAETTLREALALSRKLHDEDRTLLGLSNLTKLMIKLGRKDEAAALLAQSIDQLRTMHGDKSAESASVLLRIASPLLSEGLLDEAQTAFEQALAFLDDHERAETAEAARGLESLAEIARRRGHTDAAEARTDEAIAVWRAIVRLQRGFVPDACASAGRLLEQRQRDAEAEAAYREGIAYVLGPRTDRLGAFEPITALAKLLARQGRLDEAIAEYRRVIAFMEQRDGRGASSVRNLLSSFVAFLDQHGRVAEAGDLLRARDSVRGENPAGDEGDVSDKLTRAFVLKRTGDSAGAESLLRRTVEELRQTGSGDSRDLTRTLFQLASLLREDRRFAEAETLERERLAVSRKREGPDGPSVPDALTWLGITLSLQRKNAEAEVVLREALALMRAKPPASRITLTNALQFLADLMTRRTEWSEAEPLLREEIALREGRSPPDSLLGTRRAALGWVLLELRRFPEAEPLLVGAVEDLRARAEASPTAPRRTLTDTIGRLVRLYIEWGKPEQAATWRQSLTDPAPPPRPEAPR
jgi:eukaryotic-like serine/threonine-protein kinase